MPPGELYVSPLDLVQDHGVVTTPLVPTLRVARPIFAPDGKPFGIFIVNIDMRPALDRARSSVRPGESIYVVNGRGEYLVHPDRTREFGLQLGKPGDWRSDFPSLVSSLGAMRSVTQVLPEQGPRPDGIALAPTRLADSEWVAVIERVPNAVFMASAAAIRNSSLLVGLIAVLCAAGLAVFIARTLTRPIIQLTAAVEELNAEKVRRATIRGSGVDDVIVSDDKTLLGIDDRARPGAEDPRPRPVS